MKVSFTAPTDESAQPLSADAKVESRKFWQPERRRGERISAGTLVRYVSGSVFVEESLLTNFLLSVSCQ
jgi:hypothetical protein